MLMLVILSPACLPRLRNNEESEDDAGDADRENADKDGGEAVVGVQHMEQLGGDKTEKPERTVVQASHDFLGGSEVGQLLTSEVFLTPALLVGRAR